MDTVRVGRSLRALRIRRGWRQADLAQRAQVGREAISQLERGMVERTSLVDLQRVAATLGADIDVRIRWRGEHLDRLLDEAHAATVAAIVVRLGRLGWESQLEKSFSIWGERGSIDVLAWHPATKTLLVVEVKSVIPDIQAMLHGLDRKARLARDVAARFGWRPATVGSLLVVAESPTSRGRVRRSAVVLEAALPDRGPRVRAWLRVPSGPLRGLLFLSNAAHAHARHAIWRRERVHVANPRPLRSVEAFGKVRASAGPRGDGAATQ
jgi:transcriptional regulator with XRE-family HTH domain